MPAAALAASDNAFERLLFLLNGTAPGVFARLDASAKLLVLWITILESRMSKIIECDFDPGNSPTIDFVCTSRTNDEAVRPSLGCCST
jgi:hypothetical protein